jgi:ATP-dependent protease ClpP protease subunit
MSTMLADRPNRAAADALLADLAMYLPAASEVRIRGIISRDSERPIRQAIEAAARRHQGVSLFVDSGGGDVDVANAVERDLRDCGEAVYGLAGKRVCSAAVGPWMTARHRMCAPDSFFLLHSTRAALPRDADARELRQLASVLDADDRAYKQMLETHLRLPKRCLELALSDIGWRADAHQALAIGLVHAVQR